MKMQVCFVNSEQPAIDEKHVAFVVSKQGEEISLGEVRELTYPHPDTEEMIVKLLDIKFIRKAKVFTQDSADLELFFAAQNNIRK